MIRRLLIATVLLIGAALVAVAGPVTANAAPYPPSNPASLTASAYDPCAGASNVIGGNGFDPGETVRLVLAQTGEIARVTVGADGSFRLTVTIPLESRGSDQVTATGLTSGRSAGLTLAIPCIAGQSESGTRVGGALASTGAQVGGAVLVALVLFGAGTALVVAGRRRRGHRTAR